MTHVQQVLEIVTLVVAILGVPTIFTMVRWARRSINGTFRHAVGEVVDDKLTPIITRMDSTDEWRNRIEHELSPNSGTSLVDKTNAIYDVVVELQEAGSIQRKMMSAKADFHYEGEASEGQFT